MDTVTVNESVDVDAQRQEILARREALEHALEALGRELLPTRERAVLFRSASGIERKWEQDQQLFEGEDPTQGKESMLTYAQQEQAPPTNNELAYRSKVVMNIVRGKCEIAEGRFADIQLPVSGKNWGLKPTPKPDLAKAATKDSPAVLKETGEQLVDPSGQPLSVKDIAAREMDTAREKMNRMTEVIDDQLTECEYNAESRKVIESAVRLGTGILKGPNTVRKVKKAWFRENEEDGFQLRIMEELKPASENVSVWDVFPDPDCGDRVRSAGYIWERDTVLARDLQDLAKVPGYFPSRIGKVLSEDPVKLQVGMNPREKSKLAVMSIQSKSSNYERWTYYGDINRKQLRLLGLEEDLPDYALQELQEDMEEEDLSQHECYSACVVFVNDTPIKVCINPLDTGELPFDFFQWTTVSGSPWGVGVARILTWPQRVITAGWRAMLDNAGDSAGANIIIGAGVEPENDSYVLTGKKLWRAIDEELDVRKAFSQFQIENHQAAYQSLIEFAMRFADIETSIPMLFQGETKTMPETLGATNIIVDSNNVALRGRVKRYDDNITVPHLKRYYDWNMQHHPDDEIKGDFNVDPKGASVLFEKDQQAQTLLSLITQAKMDPDIALRVDWDKATVQLFSNLRLNNILKTDEEYKQARKTYEEQQAQGPQDPKIIGAQIRAEGDLKKASLVQQSDIEEIKAKNENAEKERMFRAQSAEREREFKLRMKEMDVQTKMMEFAEKRQMTLADVKKELSIKAMEINTQKELASSPDAKPAPEIAEPVAEPAGRAEPGYAYQH